MNTQIGQLILLALAFAAACGLTAVILKVAAKFSTHTKDDFNKTFGKD